MLLTVLNDLRQRNRGSLPFHVQSGRAAQWGSMGQSPIPLGGSCGNSFLPTLNEHVPTPGPPSQIPSEIEALLSQGCIFVLLRYNLTRVAGQMVPDQGTWWSHRSIFRLLLPSFLGAMKGTYFPCYRHSVEDVPQHDPHHHFVPEVEDNTFPVVFPFDRDLGHTRVAWKNRDFCGLWLCLTLWSNTSSCGQSPKQKTNKTVIWVWKILEGSFDTCFKLL